MVMCRVPNRERRHHQLADDQHVFPIVEIYDGTDSFTAHREGGHFAEIDRAQIIPLL